MADAESTETPSVRSPKTCTSGHKKHFSVTGPTDTVENLVMMTAINSIPFWDLRGWFQFSDHRLHRGAINSMIRAYDKRGKLLWMLCLLMQRNN